MASCGGGDIRLCTQKLAARNAIVVTACRLQDMPPRWNSRRGCPAKILRTDPILKRSHQRVLSGQ